MNIFTNTLRINLVKFTVLRALLDAIIITEVNDIDIL